MRPAFDRTKNLATLGSGHYLWGWGMVNGGGCGGGGGGGGSLVDKHLMSIFSNAKGNLFIHETLAKLT